MNRIAIANLSGVNDLSTGAMAAVTGGKLLRRPLPFPPFPSPLCRRFPWLPFCRRRPPFPPIFVR